MFDYFSNESLWIDVEYLSVLIPHDIPTRTRGTYWSLSKIPPEAFGKLTTVYYALIPAPPPVVECWSSKSYPRLEKSM